MRFIKLNNDVKMPIMGLGTWKSEPNEVYSAIRWALKLGYVHFDCAPIYGNEDVVGQAFFDAMNEDGLERKDIFVTSKLWNNAHREKDVIPALKDTLFNLKTDYLDLYLIHWPVAQKKDAIMPLTKDDMIELSYVPIEETWGAMEEAYKQGLVKAIGVSNFGVERLGDLLEKAEINPMVNQVECHPYLQQRKLLEFCKNNMIAMTAYSPIGSGTKEILEDNVIVEIAKRLEVSPAQVLLAWNMARDVAVIPKSVKKEHLQENLRALNVGLDIDDINSIDTLDKNKRFVLSDVFEVGNVYSDIFA